VKQKPKPRIALLREKAGLTQLELSRLVGVTESTIQNWESGRTGTDHIERIIRFCKALNCQVEDLIDYTSLSTDESVAKPTSLNDLHQLLGNHEPVAVNPADTEVKEQPQVQST
jgi:transcriptional regulator with XRE-family HTH domain